MKAVVITRPGAPDVLEIQDRPDPVPGFSQVRVRVRASALNRADVSQRLGRYPAPPGSPPDIPGLEYAGEIDLLGDGATMWNVGDSVMGIVGSGGHAEYVCVHEREVIPSPRGLAIEAAAAIPEVFLTAYDAVFLQMKMTAGETLLIHAAGSGVGTAAIQLASVSGIRTVGTSRSSEKLERAKDLGLDVAVLAHDESWISRVIEESGGDGVNGILDLVGAAYFKGNVEALAVRGRMIVVGLTAGSAAEIDLRSVMRKRMTLIGTLLRSRSIEEKITLARKFAERIVPMFESGRLEPVIERVMTFSEIREAHRLLESNQTFGKVVLSWS